MDEEKVQKGTEPEIDPAEIGNISDFLAVVFEMCDRVEIRNEAMGLAFQDAVKGTLSWSVVFVNGSLERASHYGLKRLVAS